jgi:DNA-binding response OmpR family regulator
MKIIIVDSDWRFVSKATRYFESFADTIIQKSAFSLVSKAEEWEPDLIILSAEYATEDLLESLQNISIRPAVLLTEHMSRYDRAWAAWQRGGDELLMKPVFKSQDLRNAVSVAMQKAAVNPRYETEIHRHAIPA